MPPLVLPAIAFVGGIVVAAGLDQPWPFWAWLLLWPLGFLLLWRREPHVHLPLWLLLILLLGAVRFAWAAQPPSAGALAYYNDHGRALLRGVVESPPDARDAYLGLRVAVTEIESGGVITPTHGLARVEAPASAHIRYGDRVRVEGAPATPPEYAGFSYRDYLAREDVYTLVRYARVAVLAHDQGDPLRAALYAARDRAAATIDALFPEPAAALLDGILLGLESGIPAGLKEAFAATNTSHIVAISGFNLTLLAGVLARLVGLVWPGRRGALLVLAGIALYTLFVGASASVVRAALMGSVTLLAVQFRRQALALNSLAAAVLLMLLLNPRTLWDLGFQLSALATLGILLFVPWLQGLAGGAAARLNPTLAPSWVRALARFGKENVVVTLAAQLTTTPLLVFTFHQFSLVGLLTNLLVLPVQPLVMIAGGLATLAGLVWLPLGHLVAWFAWAFTQWTIVIVQWTASLPYAAVDLGPVDWPVLALYALLLLALWQWPWVRAHLSPDLLNRAFARPALILLPCAAALFVLLAALATQPDGQTHVEFLALDAGDATFLRTPAGARALVDAGSAPSQVLAALGTRLPFWERRLDLLVLTANDDAHLNGATAVLERYDVGLVVAPAPPDKRSTAFSEWRALLRQKNIPTQTLQDGLALDLDGLRLLVLCAGENDAAPMIQVTAGSRTFLLADALSKKQVEAWDKRDAPEARLLPVHVLVPPPQVTPAFLARVAPESVVLFVGRATRTQPSAALLQTLGDLPLYRTDLHGTVEITTDGERLAIRTEK